MTEERVEVTAEVISQLQILNKVAQIAAKRDGITSFEVLRYIQETEKFFAQFEV